LLRFGKSGTPFFHGSYFLILAVSLLLAPVASSQENHRALNNLSAIEYDSTARQKAGLIYFPHRICLDDDTVRSGCIYGVAVHLDNIGTECSVESPEDFEFACSARIVNPTEYPRWCIVGKPFQENYIVQLNQTELPVSPVNDGVIGVLVPPFSEGLLMCQREGDEFPLVHTILIITALVFIFTIAIVRKRSKKMS